MDDGKIYSCHLMAALIIFVPKHGSSLLYMYMHLFIDSVNLRMTWGLEVTVTFIDQHCSLQMTEYLHVGLLP